MCVFPFFAVYCFFVIWLMLLMLLCVYNHWNLRHHIY